jgi:hypothetical protein
VEIGGGDHRPAKQRPERHQNTLTACGHKDRGLGPSPLRPGSGLRPAPPLGHQTQPPLAGSERKLGLGTQQPCALGQAADGHEPGPSTCQPASSSRAVLGNLSTPPEGMSDRFAAWWSSR